MWPSVGLPLFGSAYYNAPHERCEASARERLGDERYEECVRAGARLGQEAAVCAGARAGPGRGRSVRCRRRAALPAPEMRKPAASPTSKGGETTG